MKKDRKGFVMFRGDVPEIFNVKYLKESEIPNYLKYVRKNTGKKRLHYKFRVPK